MTFGEKLAKARKAKKLTQEQLSEKLDVTNQAISAWEHGEYLPDTRKLLSLRDALGVSLDALFSDDRADWRLRIGDEQSLIDRAIEFAAVKHAGACRKGTSIPYITHPVEAFAIVCTLTQDEEVRAAAVPHDTLEDTETTKEELIANFGARVADLVSQESENKREAQSPQDTWQIRKQETLDHLALASHEVKMIALGDKLSNIRAIERDHEEIGEKLWERFNQKDPALHGWYYGQIADILGRDDRLNQTAAYREYAHLVREVFGQYKRLELRCVYSDSPDVIRRDLPSNATIRSLILDRTDDEDLIEIQKMAMTLDAFLRTDAVGFDNVHLVIVNDPEGDEVSWARTEDGYVIHLCAESGWHWCQAAYQMGYNLMHCLIDHTAAGPQISWAEELICETAALELLWRLQQRWPETPFSEEDPAYGDCIGEYIQQNLEDEGTSALLRCKDKDELSRIDRRNDFADRLDESHDLYNLISGDDLIRLAQIRKYASDNLLLHTHLWRDLSGGSRAIDYICRIQEKIPGCEVPAGVSTDVNLVDSRPTEKQLENFTRLICDLQCLPCEHVTFIFMNPNKGDCEQIGLVFYQVARCSDNAIIAEIRLDTKEGRKMFRLRTDEARAVAVLNEIVIMNDVPDLSAWQDITKFAF